VYAVGSAAALTGCQLHVFRDVAGDRDEIIRSIFGNTQATCPESVSECQEESDFPYSPIASHSIHRPSWYDLTTPLVLPPVSNAKYSMNIRHNHAIGSFLLSIIHSHSYSLYMYIMDVVDELPSINADFGFHLGELLSSIICKNCHDKPKEFGSFPWFPFHRVTSAWSYFFTPTSTTSKPSQPQVMNIQEIKRTLQQLVYFLQTRFGQQELYSVCDNYMDFYIFQQDRLLSSDGHCELVLDTSAILCQFFLDKKAANDEPTLRAKATLRFARRLASLIDSVIADPIANRMNDAFYSRAYIRQFLWNIMDTTAIMLYNLELDSQL
jgi:hypothetical protein